MDKGALQVIVHGVTKTWLSNWHFLFRAFPSFYRLPAFFSLWPLPSSSKPQAQYLQISLSPSQWPLLSSSAFWLSCISLKRTLLENWDWYIHTAILKIGASQVVLVVKNLPFNAEDIRDVDSILGLEDPLEESLATHPSILAGRIPWAEEPGRLQSMGSQRVRHNWSDLAHMHALKTDK